MENNQNWQCPYCGHHQILLEGKDFIITKIDGRNIVDMSEHGPIVFEVVSTSCLNTQCKKLFLKGYLSKIDWGCGGENYRCIKTWSLLPDSIAKPQPDYIPAPIRKDYNEACQIANLSPNASAVLARRCLQSMIRNFCDIEKNTLHEEIKTLKTSIKERKIPNVTEESIQAIDSIRTMGNIGAHMEKPTGILIDIEPKEANLLIQLIETLFKDWYVSRYERQERLKSIQEMTIKKEQQKVAKK